MPDDVEESAEAAIWSAAGQHLRRRWDRVGIAALRHSSATRACLRGRGRVKPIRSPDWTIFPPLDPAIGTGLVVAEDVVPSIVQ